MIEFIDGLNIPQKILGAILLMVGVFSVTLGGLYMVNGPHQGNSAQLTTVPEQETQTEKVTVTKKRIAQPQGTDTVVVQPGPVTVIERGGTATETSTGETNQEDTDTQSETTPAPANEPTPDETADETSTVAPPSATTATPSRTQTPQQPQSPQPDQKPAPQEVAPQQPPQQGHNLSPMNADQ